MKSPIVVSVLTTALLVAAAGRASAMTESCQNDLNKYGQTRVEAINRINAFRKKRPTASQACSAFTNLVTSESRMVKWMEENKEWCQIPDALIADLKKSSTQSTKARGQACAAAKQEAQGGAVPRSGAAPRPTVRLPQGAL